jgi:hypothetical protein
MVLRVQQQQLVQQRRLFGLKILKPARVSLLSGRLAFSPYTMFGPGGKETSCLGFAMFEVVFTASANADVRHLKKTAQNVVLDAVKEKASYEGD